MVRQASLTRIGLALAVLGLSACGDGRPPEGAVTTVLDIANIESHIPDAVSDAGYVASAGSRAGDWGRAIQRGQSAIGPDISTVRISFTADQQDRLGNPQPAPLMSLVYSTSDLRAADYGALSPGQIIGLAKSTSVQPAGLGAAAKWCAGGSHRAEAPDFCAGR